MTEDMPGIREYLIVLVIALIALGCSLGALSSMQWQSEWNREFGEIVSRLERIEGVINAAPVIERSPSGYAKFIDNEGEV